MSTSDPMPQNRLPQQPNPYTDEAPLRVTDHPLRANRSIVLIGAVVALAPVIWLLVRLLGGAAPVISGDLGLALAIGVPLGLVIALFPLLVASGARVTLGATSLTRRLRSARGTTKTIRLDDIRTGIHASNVRYRRSTGQELVLFLDGGEILWIAEGIEPDDVARIARALSAYGVREYAEPITNQQLAALVRKARRAGGKDEAGGAASVS